MSTYLQNLLPITVLGGITSYFLIDIISQHYWRKQNKKYIDYLYTLNYEKSESPGTQQPFTLTYKIIFSNLLIKTMFKQHLLTLLDHDHMEHLLREEFKSYTLQAANYENTNPQKFEAFEKKALSSHAILNDLSSMDQPAFLEKYKEFISATYKKTLIDSESFTAMKPHIGLFYGMLFNIKKYRLFNEALSNFFRTHESHTLSFSTAAERDMYLEILQNSIYKAASYFLYREMHSEKGQKKMVQSYIDNTVLYRGYTGFSEHAPICNYKKADYEISHYVSMHNDSYHYHYEVLMNTTSVKGKLTSSNIQKIFNESISAQVNTEKYYGIKSGKILHNRFISSSYMFENYYDILLLTDSLNKTMEQYLSEQHTAENEGSKNNSTTIPTKLPFINWLRKSPKNSL